ncbi:MAG: glycerophosphodiester phosphodiesterase family protein, partial [Polaribacter sp.]
MKNKITFVFTLLLLLSIYGLKAQCIKGQPPTQSKECLKHVFNNPKLYPNFVLLSAHRGYWKDVPENSIPAIKKAMDLDVEMVELDLMKTANNFIYLMHDWHLGRLTNGYGTLRDKNWNFYKTWNEIKNVKLRDPIYRNQITNYTMPLLREALIICRDYKKGKVLVSLDKADVFMDEVYKIVKELGMTDVVTWKTKIQLFNTPNGLKNYYRGKPTNLTETELDELVSMYTPTIFGEYYAQHKSTVLNEIDAFIAAGSPGFEMVYFNNQEKMLTDRLVRQGKTYANVLDYLRDKNTRVIQFPEWPETCQGNWSPTQGKFRDLNLATDHRGNWTWMMSSGNP